MDHGYLHLWQYQLSVSNIKISPSEAIAVSGWIGYFVYTYPQGSKHGSDLNNPNPFTILGVMCMIN